MKIKFPLHMEPAIKTALDGFAKDGFVYSINSPTERTETHIIYDFDANGQELVSLGIKIGAALKAIEPAYPCDL